MAQTPKWATPARQVKLMRLRQFAERFCCRGHYYCNGLLHEDHYEWQEYKQTFLASEEDQERAPVAKRQKRCHCNGLIHPEFKGQEYLGGHMVEVENRQANLVPVRVEHYVNHEEQTLYHKLLRKWMDARIEQDRDDRWAEYHREQQSLHDGTTGCYGGRFDPVQRDVFLASQPEYYPVSQGVCAALSHPYPVQIIRVASANIHLHVNLAAAFAGVALSKNKRKKLMKYGKGTLPEELALAIDQLCKAAVRDFWTEHETRA